LPFVDRHAHRLSPTRVRTKTCRKSPVSSASRTCWRDQFAAPARISALRPS
jgi:hypothetical protein